MAKKVIFVDDSRTVLASVELAVEELVNSGLIEFVTYNNPIEFLAEIEANKISYDLLFTDINMPQNDRFRIVTEAKKYSTH